MAMKQFLPILLILSLACTRHNPAVPLDQAAKVDTTAKYLPMEIPERENLTTSAISFQLTGLTSDISNLKQSIYTIAKKNASLVKSEYLEKTPNGEIGSFILAVPRQKLDSLQSALQMLPITILRQSHSIEDLSITIKNLSQRVREKREINQRYRQLLQDASSKEVVSQLETSIAVGRSELELLTNELREARRRVKNVTITINIDQTSPPIKVTSTAGTPPSSAPAIQGKKGTILISLTHYISRHWPWLLLLGVVAFMIFAVIKVTKPQKKVKRGKKKNRKKKKKSKHKVLPNSTFDESIQ